MSREAQTALRRVMGFRDVVMFLVVAVVGLRWIATAAAIGPSALALWLIGMAAFFLPLAFTVLSLAARHPEEGGLYVWVRHSFGEFAGFMAAWMYWASNLVYMPGLLYFAAGSALFVLPGGESLSASPGYFVLASMVGLGLALGLHVMGLGVGKRLQNAGAMGTWIPVAILVAAGFTACFLFGPATPITLGSLAPAISLRDMALWSTIAFAFSGLEAASLMGGEIVEPRRTVPRAILAAGAAIAAIYVLGTLAVLLALPAREVSGFQGITQAIARVAERVEAPLMSPIAAGLITLGSLGGVAAWLGSCARLPFVAGLEGYLPKAFARLDPRSGAPVTALMVQAVAATVVALLGQAGTTVQGAYDALVSMGVVTYFLPYLLMFAAAFREAGKEPASGARGILSRLLPLIGGVTTAASIGLALVPPEGAEHPGFVVLKVVGASAVMVALGAAVYWSGRARRRLG